MNTILAPIRRVLEVARLRPFDTSTPDGRSKERYRRILLSTIASTAGRVVATLASLVAVPIVIGALGKERYGLWVAISAIAPWVALFDLGLVAGLVNAIAEAHGRDDREAARAYFSTALCALTVVVLAVAVTAGAATWGTPWWRAYAAPTYLAGDAQLGTRIALGLALVAMPFGLVAQVYAGYQKSYVATVFTTFASVVSLGLLVLAMRRGASFPWVVAATSSTATLGGLGALVHLSTRGMPWLRPSARAVSWAALRRVLQSSVPLYLFQVGALLVNQSQQLVLARCAGLDTVAEYDLLMKMYLLATGLITTTTLSFAPTFREAAERGEFAWVRSSFWHLVRLRVTLGLAANVALLLGGNFILRTWLRRLDFQHPPAVWLALAGLILVAVWASSFGELLTVLDHVWPQVWIVLAQGGATVVLTWALGARLGVLGGLVAIAVPAAALTAWVLPLLAHRVLAGSPRIRAALPTPSRRLDSK